MSATPARPATRNWADLLAILAGVALVGTSVWPTDFTTDPGTRSEALDPGLLVPLHIVAGSAAVAAVVLAQRPRWRGAARALLIGTALLLVAGLLLFRDFGVRALTTVVLPAVALVAASFGVGPMSRDD